MSMPLIPSLNVRELNAATNALLELAYARLIENYQRATLSQIMRNANLSGDLTSGTVRAARYTNSRSQPYGTARAAGNGDPLVEKPVLVQIKEYLEIVEEFEQFDARTMPAYLNEVIAGRNTDHAMTMARDMEEDFFMVGRDEGTQVTLAGANPSERLESMVLNLSTLQNEFFNGIDRNMIYVVMNDATYSQLRVHMNLDIGNASVNSAAENIRMLNGVWVAPTNYLPPNVSMMAMIRGAIAMPSLILPYTVGQLPLSYADALMTAYAKTAAAVMPDAIFWAGN